MAILEKEYKLNGIDQNINYLMTINIVPLNFGFT